MVRAVLRTFDTVDVQAGLDLSHMQLEYADSAGVIFPSRSRFRMLTEHFAVGSLKLRVNRIAIKISLPRPQVHSSRDTSLDISLDISRSIRATVKRRPDIEDFCGMPAFGHHWIITCSAIILCHFISFQTV